MIEEVWRDVKGYEGLYQVSSEGRVKTLARTCNTKGGSKRTVKERILKPWLQKDGYLLVGLNVDGKRKTATVHRLVCKAFHDNLDNKPEINHINEDKADNRACNLEWCTRRENVNHGSRNDRAANGIAKALSKPVGQYTLDDKLIKIWPSANEAERQAGFCHSTISQAANGKYKQGYGFIWKYI